MRRKFVVFALASGLLFGGRCVSVQAQEAAKDSLDRAPDSVYVGTPSDIVSRMLEMAQVTKDDVVYDLGCGDGRILVAAAERYGCRCIGFDIDPVRVRESLENVKRHRVEKLVQIERKDIFTVDLKPASVIMLYVLPDMNRRLIPQYEKMKDGARIVAHDFGIGGMVPDKTVRVTSKVDGVEHVIYHYTTPLKKEQ